MRWCSGQRMARPRYWFARSIAPSTSCGLRTVAITDHDASGESTVWFHWGPLLSHQANLAALIAATGVHFHDRRIVYPPRWEDASTLRLAAGRFEYVTSAPTHRFRYRLGAAAPTPVP